MGKPRRAPEITQETIDAARKPMTAKEREVYDKANRRWRPGRLIGPQAVLDSLVEKGWLDGTYYALAERKEDAWVYQRRHSLD